MISMSSNDDIDVSYIAAWMKEPPLQICALKTWPSHPSHKLRLSKINVDDFEDQEIEDSLQRYI